MHSRFSAFGSRAGRAFLAAVVVGLIALPSRADHGRFLPDANTNGPAGSVHTWGNAGGGGNQRTLDANIVDTTKGIPAGEIRFDYDTATRNPGGNVRGGAVLSGGFFLADGVGIKPGFTLAWVQTVVATRTGTEAANSFNLPLTNAGEYPDADPRDRMAPGLDPTDPLFAPTYPFNSAIRSPMGMMPTLGFQDFPNRGFADGNQSWLGELGLACISNNANINMGGQMFREVRVVGTFVWGFDLTNLPAASPGINNVSPFGPIGFGDARVNFLATLNNFYDGMGGGGRPDGMGGMLPQVGTDRYTFARNSNCFVSTVPEPGTLCLLIVAIVSYRSRRGL